MRTKTTIFLLLLLSSIANAQLLCGTESTSTASLQQNTPSVFALNSLQDASICVNVFIHIIGNDEGQTSIPANSSGDIIEKLNESFKKFNISFNSLGTGSVNNTTFSDDGVGVYGGNVDQLFALYDHPNAIDIFIAEKADWAGRANGVLSTDMVVHKDYAHTGIVSHEMGHCLNLYHTHELKFGQELPNGSNCKTAGDLLCDTPADPSLDIYRDDINGNCELNYTIVEQGISYYPDTKNLMSYTKPDCMQRFSAGQVARMKDAIYHAQILQAVLTCCQTAPVSLSQTKEVCYAEERTFRVSNLCYSTQTTWQTSSNLQVIRQNNTSITVKAVNPTVSGQGWVRAIFTDATQPLTQHVQVGVPNAYLQTGDIESQFFDIFYKRWTRLFLHGVSENEGWEWDVDYSNVIPSNTRSVLIYPKVYGPIYVRVRAENQCGKGPWLTEYFEVTQSGGHKILRQ